MPNQKHSRRCRCRGDERDHDGVANWSGLEGYTWPYEWLRNQRGPMLTTLGTAEDHEVETAAQEFLDAYSLARTAAAYSRSPDIGDVVRSTDYDGQPYLYHWTPQHNLANILENGLQPGCGQNWRLCLKANCEGRVFFSTEPDKWASSYADPVAVRVPTDDVTCYYDGGEWVGDELPDEFWDRYDGRFADCYSEEAVPPELFEQVTGEELEWVLKDIRTAAVSKTKLERLITWLSSNEAYRWLPYDSWMSGGCWLLAEALHRVLPGTDLMAVRSDQHKEDQIEHVVVELPGWRYMDGSGIYESADELLNYLEMEERYEEPYLTSLNYADLAETDIECPVRLLDELVEKLRAVLTHGQRTAALSDQDTRELARRALQEIAAGLAVGQLPPDSWERATREGVPYYRKDLRHLLGLDAEVHLVGSRYIERFVDPLAEVGGVFQADGMDGTTLIIWPRLNANGTITRIDAVKNWSDLFHELIHAFDDYDPTEQDESYYTSKREWKAYLLTAAEELERRIKQHIESLQGDLKADIVDGEITDAIMSPGVFDPGWEQIVVQELGWNDTAKFLERARTLIPPKWQAYMGRDNRERLDQRLLEIRDQLLDKYSQELKQWLGATLAQYGDYQPQERKVASTSKQKNPTRQMVDFFEQRTREHINRVIKFMKQFDGFADFGLDELRERALQHDQDKYQDPELVLPYCWVTEYHRVNNEEGSVPDELQEQYDLADEATGQHVQQNRHHPEAHESLDDMTPLDLVEMVADWAAMAEELDQGSPRGWADQNVGSKWEFSDDQRDFIYEAIDWLDSKAEAKTARTAALSDQDTRELARRATQEVLDSLTPGEQPSAPWQPAKRKGIPYFRLDARHLFGLPAEIRLVGYTYLTKFVSWFGDAGAAFSPDQDGTAVVTWPILADDGTVHKITAERQRELFHEMVHAFDDYDPEELMTTGADYNTPREFKAYFLMGAEEIERYIEDRLPKLVHNLSERLTFDRSWWFFTKNFLGWDTEENFLDHAYRFLHPYWVHYLSPENKALLEEKLLELRGYLLDKYKALALEQYRDYRPQEQKVASTLPGHYFSDPRPSDRLQQVILSNLTQAEEAVRERGAPLGCQGAAQVWASILLDNGFDGEVHDGEYYPWDPEENPDSFGEGHTWLVVFDDAGAVLFDPTAGQFDPQQEGPRTRDRYSEYPDVYGFDEVYCNASDDDDDGW